MLDNIVLLPGEQIKQIENFPQYYITSFGRVWSKNSNRWLKPTVSQRGSHKREIVSLGRNNSFYIHRLVAKAFIPNPNNFEEVDHIDTDGLNNKVENLRWVTHEKNMDNEITKEKIKSNTGYLVEIEEIATGKIFYGYDELSEYTGLSKTTLYKHTKNKVKNPKWRLTGKRVRPKT